MVDYIKKGDSLTMNGKCIPRKRNRSRVRKKGKAKSRRSVCCHGECFSQGGQLVMPGACRKYCSERMQSEQEPGVQKRSYEHCVEQKMPFVRSLS